MSHMPRRIALWSIEFAAGAAAVVLGLLTLPMSLFAPLYPVCASATPGRSACATTRYISLVAAHPTGSVWALLLGLLALTLVGAAGAVTDARRRFEVGERLTSSWGLFALWAAALLVFAICALGWRGPLGIIYLPTTMVLALASYVALLRRLAARRAALRRAE